MYNYAVFDPLSLNIFIQSLTEMNLVCIVILEAVQTGRFAVININDECTLSALTMTIEMWLNILSHLCTVNPNLKSARPHCVLLKRNVMLNIQANGTIF